MRGGNLPDAVIYLQNAVRLGASLECRLLLSKCYLRLARNERNPCWRWQLYRGAIYEASKVPFDSLDEGTKQALTQAAIEYDAINRVALKISDELKAKRGEKVFSPRGQ